MIDARFTPIKSWPGKKTPANERRASNVFKATYQNTLNLLEYEIGRIGGTNILVEAYLRRDQIRNDGWPFSNATPSEPGVVVSFQSQFGPLRLPCDRFSSWTHNLRAIALHLENLRHASLYGVGAAGEQYAGWKQIAAPGATMSMTVEEAARFVAERAYGVDHPNAPAESMRATADGITGDAMRYRKAYREAATKLHPDVNSNKELWHTLQDAKAILDRHHGHSKTQEALG